MASEGNKTLTEVHTHSVNIEKHQGLSDFLYAALYKALGIHSASRRKFQVKLNPCVCLFCGSQLFLWHVTLIGGRYKISFYSYTTCSFSSAYSPKCLINKLWTLMGNSAFLGECWPRDNRKRVLRSLHAVLLAQTTDDPNNSICHLLA